MQTSLNPLISTIIKGDRLASTLTFGQFIEAIASFLAPSSHCGELRAHCLSSVWDGVLFPVYTVIAVIAILSGWAQRK